jgi:putative tryptophan/tyrosine transport system substrate-binding protein
MRRRDLIGVAASMALSPVASVAQGQRVYRVVFVGITPFGTAHHFLTAFEQGLREHGRTPGRDVVIEVRSADGDSGRYPAVLDAVVRSKPDVIVSSINANTLPLKTATQSIPIVMTIGTEVVSAGLVRSFARPGGNITGLTWDVGPELATKRMEFLKELVPTMKRVGILWEAPYGEEYLKTTQDAATVLRLQSFGLEFGGDMERAFAELRRSGADAVYVHHGNQLFPRRPELAIAAMRQRLPTGCGSAEVVDAGALMSYGPNLADLFRRAAGYVDKILKGVRPADLPVERPTKVELVVNRRTAEALKLSLPQSLLARVDRIVD